MIPKDWKLLPLESLASVERGKFSARPRNDPQYYGGSIPFVQTGDVAAAKGDMLHYSQTLNDLGLSVSRLFPKGTILITIAANIGDIAVTPIDLACPDSIVGIQANSDVCANWLRHALVLKKPDLESMATQNAQKNINLQILRPLLIPTPPIDEQKKIAEILGTWDAAIGTIGNLLAEKQSLKRSIENHLLFGEKRVCPPQIQGFIKHSCFSVPKDWELSKLSQVFQERRETSADLDQYPLASLTIEYGLIEKPDRYIRDFLLKDKADNQYRIVYPGDFVYNPMNLRWGAIDFSRFTSPILISAYYNVLTPDIKVISSSLLLAILKSPQMIHIYNNVGIGSLNEKKRVHLSDFLELEIPIAPAPESVKINSILQKIHEEIEAISRYQDLLKEQKQGLMQQLLTGELSVKTGRVK
jgi:type I restriction enzyme, S subunit